MKPSLRPGEIFDALTGRWHIERVVPGQAVMTGSASFKPVDADTSEYREEGKLRLDTGQEFDAEQTYLFKRLKNGFAVHFSRTGQLFHNMEFLSDSTGILTATAHHPCKDDRYQSRYQIHSDNSFELLHEVLGPRKNYVIRTIYTRLRD